MYYIRRIQLSNIRRFKTLDLDFEPQKDSATPRMTTLLIGKNGTCKTTLLRSIVIGLCDKSEGNALLAEEGIKLIDDKRQKATIKITLSSDTNTEPLVVQTELEWVENREEVVRHKPDDFKQPFVCGYGVGRLFDGPMDTGYRYANSTYTLFRYDSNLTYPELVLRRLKDFLNTDVFTRTVKGMERAIGLPRDYSIRMEKGGGPVIRSKSLGTIGIRSWADGHRVPFNLILDVFSWAMQADAVTKDGQVRGILLIDEIGQLLHPLLEVDVLERFRSLFAEMQLIAISQSPMVALGARPGELVSLKEDGRHVVKEDVLPDFSGYSVEDIVADRELFDAAVYSPETNERLSRYRQLAAKPNNKLTSAQKNEVRKLGAELASQQIPESKESADVKALKALMRKFNL